MKKSDWNNSVFIESVEDIKKLKNLKGSNIQVWGGGELVQLLLKNDLVDELRLKIHPLTLGKGKNFLMMEQSRCIYINREYCHITWSYNCQFQASWRS